MPERQCGIEHHRIRGEESLEVLYLGLVRDRMRHQAHPEAGHGVVVARRVPVHRREVLDPGRHRRLGIGRSMPPHHQPRQPKVVAVMEVRVGQLGAEERAQKIVVGEHRQNLHSAAEAPEKQNARAIRPGQ